MSSKVAIKVDHIHKVFKLPHEKQTSVKSAVINFYKKRTFEKQHVLKDVSFSIKEGEFFGIVGRNGSGKSTLLKLLAGIYAPTKGSITTNGKLTPFIELGVGFNPELTGRENVYLNGALLGFSRKDMNKMYDEIVEFAELDKFMDQKLKNYSSGMQVRLAFSIAIRAQSDILLIDEVLAVGDAAFQQKCYSVFADLKKQKKTIILVTHDMSAVLRFCDKAILIDSGCIIKSGRPKDIADAYLELNYEIDRPDDSKMSNKTNEHRFIRSVMANGKSSQKHNFSVGEEVRFSAVYQNKKQEPIHFGLQIFNESGNYCFGTNTRIAGKQASSVAGAEIMAQVKLDLVPGNYSMTIAVMDEAATTVLEYRPNAMSFRIAKSNEIEGIANLSHQWEERSV